MPREATTNTVAGSGWEAVVKAKGRVAEFATVAAGEFATHCDARVAGNLLVSHPRGAAEQ